MDAPKRVCEEQDVNEQIFITLHHRSMEIKRRKGENIDKWSFVFVEIVLEM